MKTPKYFNNIEPLDETGVVAWSDFITPEHVIEAFEFGLFPWPDEENSVYWSSPIKRGVIFFDNIKWSKSDLKFFKKSDFVFRINSDFETTIRTCAGVKEKSETGTWITGNLIETYIELNEMGFSKSFEVYEHEILVGGVYGFLSPNYFSAESMFYVKPNASKFALFKMIEYFKEIGLTWIDTQVTTEFTEKIGATEISREKFLNLIK